MLNAGRASPGSSKRIIRNAGTTINTLNNVTMPIDSSEGTFLFIHRALEEINLFPLT
jgi:sporulation protein YlmC with PRC-barrel domain